MPGGGGIHFGAITIDNAYITFFLWKDRNGDGIIQRGEVIAVVGQCVFSNAMNFTKVIKDSQNHRHVRTINYNRGPSTEHGVPPGGAIVYDYDVETGILVVTTVIPWPGGTVTQIYSGPASGYGWYGL